MAGSKSKASGTSSTRKKTKVFRDPIHDLIYLGPDDQWALALIDTKEFQRLRRIRQLGVAHLVYPGAEHTRFTHSLGVFNIARRMIAKLLERHKGDLEIERELERHAKTIKAAALLHDVGHGPFSHVFERVFKKGNPTLPSHEAWTCQILADPATEIHEQLNTHGIDVSGVCALLSGGKPGPLDWYLKDIVSSQLDADRLDYLLRDSLMTGSRYGQFDSEWILNALVIGRFEYVDETVKKLCLDARRGIGAIEGMLFARRLMYQHVYGHKTTRAYEAELIETLRLAIRLRDELPCDTPGPVLVALKKSGDLATDEYLALDDEVVWWALRRWAVWDLTGKTANDLVVALKRHALRLVRRQEPWASVKLNDGDMFIVHKELESLLKKHIHLEFEFHLDDFSNHPYKPYQHPRADAD